MTERKFTDEEIIKALECCSKPYCNDNKCPLYKNTINTKDCITQLSTNALDLINRQKAEIERLRNTVKTDFLTVTEKLKLSQSEIGDIRSEAKKEFAEMLKDIICKNVNRSLDNPNGYNYYPIDVYEDIDNLVKEMTEGENELD